MARPPRMPPTMGPASEEELDFGGSVEDEEAAVLEVVGDGTEVGWERAGVCEGVAGTDVEVDRDVVRDVDVGVDVDWPTPGTPGSTLLAME